MNAGTLLVWVRVRARRCRCGGEFCYECGMRCERACLARMYLILSSLPPPLVVPQVAAGAAPVLAALEALLSAAACWAARPGPALHLMLLMGLAGALGALWAAGLLLCLCAAADAAFEEVARAVPPLLAPVRAVARAARVLLWLTAAGAAAAMAAVGAACCAGLAVGAGVCLLPRVSAGRTGRLLLGMGRR